MIDNFITLLIPILLFIICYWNSKKQLSINCFFDKNYTTTLKGLSSIVVILVHIPSTYQNIIQDMTGSFAFIAVTIFFMVSSYGMEFSLERKTQYLKNFWRNRLVSLLIPCFLINLTDTIYQLIFNHNLNLLKLIAVNRYVVVLLEFCLWFYIIEQVSKILNIKKHSIDLLLISGVLCSSLYLYFFRYNAENSAQMDWCYERFGLIWGILLYRYYNNITKWLNKSQHTKIIFYTIGSITLGILYLKFKSIYFWGEFMLKIILGISIIILIFLLSQKRIFKNQANTFLGKISYEIYLSHGIAIGMIKDILPNTTSSVFILSTICTTILISSIIHPISNHLTQKLRA